MVRNVGEYELSAPPVTDIDHLTHTPYLDARPSTIASRKSPSPSGHSSPACFSSLHGDAVGRWVSLSILLFLALAVGAVALAVGGTSVKCSRAAGGRAGVLRVARNLAVDLGVLVRGGLLPGDCRGDRLRRGAHRKLARTELAGMGRRVFLSAVVGRTDRNDRLGPDASPGVPSSRGSEGLWIAAISWFLFPFVLLSSLESLVAWRPWSPRTWATLVEHPLDWIAYHLLSLAVAGVWGLFVWGGGRVLGAWIFPLGAPLLAAVLFVNARLLGRLAYKISRGR